VIEAKHMTVQSRKEKAATLFLRAEKEEERGDLRAAFRHLLAAAKLGDRGGQLNVGNFYEDGKGVCRNRAAAMYWYKRLYRRGDSSGARNIGVILRKDGQFSRALAWFERAVNLGDDSSNLDIGKHYLHTLKDPAKSIRYFQRVVRGEWVSESDVEEAENLLQQAMRKPKRRAHRGM
jgi:TPR repeat protein